MNTIPFRLKVTGVPNRKALFVLKLPDGRLQMTESASQASLYDNEADAFTDRRRIQKELGAVATFYWD